jgi:hypothetical protein
LREFNKCKNERRDSVLHSFRTTFNENFFEFYQQVVVDVVAGRVTDHVDQSSNTFLTFFHFEGLFFTTRIVVAEQWLDEFQQLIDRLLGGKLIFVFDHGLTDAQGDCSLVCEFHVVHQSGIVVHLKHLNGERI